MMDSLPREIIIEILKFLTLPQILTFGIISKKYRNIADDISLWTYLAERDLNYPPGKFKELAQNPNSVCKTSWERYQKIRYDMLPRCSYILKSNRICGIILKDKNFPYCSNCKRKIEDHNLTYMG